MKLSALNYPISNSKLSKVLFIALIISMIILLLRVTHTTAGIYNDNTVWSVGAGNTHIGFSVGADNGKPFYNYHIN